jgi:hypothetical protein
MAPPLIRVVLLFLACFPSPLRAEPAVTGWSWDQNVAGALNPLGGLVTTQLYYTKPLWNKPGVLWESARIEAGVQNEWSPSFNLARAYLKVEPLAVLNLTLSAGGIGSYRLLGFGFQRVRDYTAAFNPAAMDTVPQENRAGFWASARPSFQTAWGPLVVMDAMTWNYIRYGGAPFYYYDRFGSTILRSRDWEMINEAYLLYRFRGVFMAGLTYRALWVPAADYRSDRLCGILVYNRKVRPGLEYYAALLAGTHVNDRHYEGLPYVALMLGLTRK